MDGSESASKEMTYLAPWRGRSSCINKGSDATQGARRKTQFVSGQIFSVKRQVPVPAATISAIMGESCPLLLLNRRVPGSEVIKELDINVGSTSLIIRRQVLPSELPDCLVGLDR